jgi:hypothetical protein
MTVPQVDVTQRLHILLALNFRFTTNLDPAGSLVALVGFRLHHGVIDILVLYGEHDADAMRVPDDEPNVLLPRTILWCATGPASQVIDEVLALPVPLPDRACALRRDGS